MLLLLLRLALRRRLEGLKQFWIRLRFAVQQLGLQGKFKIALAFYQVISVRESVYGISLPAFPWLDNVNIVMFSVSDFFLPSWTCVGPFRLRLIASALWPLVLVGVAAPGMLAYEAARSRFGKDRTPFSPRRALLAAAQAAVFLSFCVLPGTAREIFFAFQCESFGYDDNAGVTKSFLSASLDVECLEAEHQQARATRVRTPHRTKSVA